MTLDPRQMIICDEDGAVLHDVRDITRCSPEFLKVLSEEVLTCACPNPFCIEGIHMPPNDPKSTETCASCHGRGALYAVSTN